MVVIPLLASLLLFGVVLWILLRLWQPSYRIDASNVLRLLDDVASGCARHQDWLVFTAIPIRYDPALDAIRLRCLAIEDAHLLGDEGPFLFDAEGRRLLAEIAAELRACEPEA